MFNRLLRFLNNNNHKNKANVQFELNRILFNQDFEIEGLFDKIIDAHKPLINEDIKVSFHTLESIADSEEHSLKQMMQVAAKRGYDDSFDMVIKPECKKCAIFRTCDSSAFFAIYNQKTLYALMKIDGKNICKRVMTDKALKSYLQITASKISYRLSDHFRNSNLIIANQVLEETREAVVITDPHGTIVKVNKAFSRITGYSKEDAIGQNPRILQSGKQSAKFYEDLWKNLVEHGTWAGEFQNRTKQGKVYDQRGTITALKDNKDRTQFYVAVMEDVTELRKQQESLNKLSLFDPMTGLPNRQKLQSDYEKFIYRKDARINEIAAIIIDLDDFKQINDALGHSFGDEVLKTVSERLVKTIGNDGLLYRFGGDEFVLISEYQTEETVAIVDRVIHAINSQFYIQFKPISLNCSIGISISGRYIKSLEQLLSRADTAMYWAKQHNRGSFAFSSNELHKSALECLQLKTELGNAINNEQLFLVYQPKRDIISSKIVGYEALVRWRHPTLGNVGPDKFIPVAEKSGQIIQIDYWVLEAALRQQSIWRTIGLKLLPISINLSLPTFIRNNFVHEVQALLDAYNIDGNLIEFEITERVALGDMKKTRTVMLALKQMGIIISMDDFGTGYSSLSYLNTMPITTLKIDKTFISNIPKERTKQGIVCAIIAMAKVLNIGTVAEGVETKDELEYLTNIGCDQIQGYFLAKPMEPMDLENWLSKFE